MIETMISTLSHRGPDAEGTWLSPRAALGHRRLIVIDPEGGLQPMVCSFGGNDYALTYNGEIYNFRELRKELESGGTIFVRDLIRRCCCVLTWSGVVIASVI